MLPACVCRVQLFLLSASYEKTAMFLLGWRGTRRKVKGRHQASSAFAQAPSGRPFKIRPVMLY